MEMALDEPQSEDEVFDKKGTKFVINKGVLNLAKPIKVDFIETPLGSGFILTSALAPL